MAYPAKTDRETILRVAFAQVERGGVEALGIRAVAAELGLAPNALYRYFEGREALEVAVAEEARAQILHRMQQAAAGKEPAEAIRSVSAAYLAFAHELPRIYEMYLGVSKAGVKTPGCARNTEFFLEQVMRVYGPEPRRAHDAAHVLWAFLHGLAVLREATISTAEQTATSLRFGLELWIAGAA